MSINNNNECMNMNICLRKILDRMIKEIIIISRICELRYHFEFIDDSQKWADNDDEI